MSKIRDPDPDDVLARAIDLIAEIDFGRSVDFAALGLAAPDVPLTAHSASPSREPAAATVAGRIKRTRRPSLSSALKQARKAGIDVKAAVITADGVELKLSQPGVDDELNGDTPEKIIANL